MSLGAPLNLTSNINREDEPSLTWKAAIHVSLSPKCIFKGGRFFPGSL